MTPHRLFPACRSLLALASAVAVALMIGPAVASAQSCGDLLSLFQAGERTMDIVQATGLPAAVVESCRRQLTRSRAAAPAGPPPMGAAGPAPFGAAGPPPFGAAGPPPVGAAGPPAAPRAVRPVP